MSIALVTQFSSDPDSPVETPNHPPSNAALPSAAAPAHDHWQRHARQWSHIGSPLRPSEEDVALMRQLLGEDPGRGLLLGVTPELTALSDEMVAVDRDAAMIDRLWRPRGKGHMAMQADWLTLPLAGRHFDFAVGDGSLNVLRHVEDYRRLFCQMRRQLRDGGLLVLRVFCAPALAETPEQVHAAALRREIGSFHAYKWRLAMALVARDGSANVPVAAIHAAFELLAPRRSDFADLAGWALADVDTIDVYRGSGLSYSFPTLEQLRLALPGNCEEVALRHGGYELAERCPVIALRFFQ